MRVFSSRFFGNIMRKLYFFWWMRGMGANGRKGGKKQGVKKAERKSKYRVQSKFPKLKNVCQNKTICKSSLFGWSKPIRNLYVWKIPVKKPRDSVPLSPVLGMLLPKCFTWARQCLKCWGISLPPQITNDDSSLFEQKLVPLSAGPESSTRHHPTTPKHEAFSMKKILPFVYKYFVIFFLWRELGNFYKVAYFVSK